MTTIGAGLLAAFLGLVAAAFIEPLRVQLPPQLVRLGILAQPGGRMGLVPSPSFQARRPS